MSTAIKVVILLRQTRWQSRDHWFLWEVHVYDQFICYRLIVCCVIIKDNQTRNLSTCRPYSFISEYYLQTGTYILISVFWNSNNNNNNLPTHFPLWIFLRKPLLQSSLAGQCSQGCPQALPMVAQHSCLVHTTPGS